MEALPVRIAVLEGELARLKEERGAEADELARMLVRIAEAERARTDAEERAGTLAERVRELEAVHEDLRRGVQTMDQTARRAELAERSASDGATALERMRTELQADRSRVTDLEAKLARTRREHGEELATLRTALADAHLLTANALEEERSASARAREQAATSEASLAAARERLAQAASLVDEIERRQEMGAALLARALEQTRVVLVGEARGSASGEPGPHPAASRPSRPPPAVPKWSRSSSPPEPTVEVLSLDEIDADLPE
jgi:chromosome segregation ATPase